MPKPSPTRTTTVRIPQLVYDQAKSIVASDSQRELRTSLNDLIVTALKAYLKAYKRRQIDAAFAGMAGDVVYQNEARRLAADFGHSDWEALELSEENLNGEPARARRTPR